MSLPTNSDKDVAFDKNSEEEIYKIISSVNNHFKNNDKSRIKREQLKIIDADGTEKEIIKYTEFSANGKKTKEKIGSLQGRNGNLAKTAEKRKPHKEQVSPRDMKKTEKDKPVIGGKRQQHVSEASLKAKERKRQRRIEKATLFFKNFLLIIIPIAIILLAMYVGQNYIRTHSDEKMRLLSIETIPPNEDETTKPLLININTANAAELTYLPGIGEVKAKRIVEYREKHGSFKSVEEILNVNGIGDSTFENIKPYITVEDDK